MQNETTTDLSTKSTGELKRTVRAEFEMALIHAETGNEFLADVHRQRVNAILSELTARKS